MSDLRRKTKAGRFGSHPTFAHWGGDTLTNSATTALSFGAAPTRAALLKASVSEHALVASAGTVTATLKKWDVSAGAAVTLSSAVDLKTLTAKQATAFTITSTLTDDQRTVDTGDTLYVDVAASGTITTAPIGLRFVAELWVLE